MLNYDPQGKKRILFSLMPQKIAQTVNIRTSPIRERILAFNDFVDTGYEAHLNFSPVIDYPDYQQLFELIDDVLSPQAKQQQFYSALKETIALPQYFVMPFKF